MAEPITFGPWAKGLVNSVPPEVIGPDMLLRAENVDIDVAGYAKTRDHFVILNESALLDPARVFVTIGGTPIDTVTGGIVIGRRFTLLNNTLVGADISGLTGVPGSSLTSPADSDRILQALPGGSFVEAWQGRLLLARGTTLFYSEPLQYNAYDPMRNFVMFPQQITWLAPLAEGVFVGTRSYVYFLRGPTPLEWELTRVDGPSWEGAGGTVRSLHMSELSRKDNRGVYACWFTSRGFAFGYGDGSVIAPQEKMIRNLPISSGRLVQHNDRLWVIPL